MPYTNYTRRRFLQHAALGTLTATLPGFTLAKNRTINDTPNKAFKPDVELELSAQNAEIPILPGASTHVFKYQGKLLKGPRNSMQALPGYLGPTLHFEQGQKVRIFFYNQLAEPSIPHWHGMHVPQKMDGHPMYEIYKGERYIFEFEVENNAGTNWYHAHTHEMTATQVYQGLAGLITVTDTQEQKLDLPSGEYDLPLVLQDRRFTNGNQLRYLKGMHQRMIGFHGDTIMVNGQVNSTIAVKTRAYRLRILNGSNARIYKLGWDDGTPLTAIGTDGGLLEKPETMPYIMLAPAERIEIWADFSGRKVGTNLTLQSLEYQSGISPMGGGMRREGGMMGDGMGRMGMTSGGLAPGASFPIVKFKISEQVGDSPKLPEHLVSIKRLTAKDISNPDKTIPIAISMRHMAFQLNGRTFEMHDQMDIEKIPVDTIQKIRIFHDNQMMGGMGGRGMMGRMMSIPHPIHLHGQQFQILSRKQTQQSNSYDTVNKGFINSGWKDTVLVMPGEEIEILKPFQDYTGQFLYHCHNLEHEDMGMMRNFQVI